MYALVSCYTFQSNLIGVPAIALTDDFIKKYYKNWYLQIDVQRTSGKVIVVARNICTTVLVTKDAG